MSDVRKPPSTTYTNADPLYYPCPKCGVGNAQRCRTGKTNRVTDTHEARWQVAARKGDKDSWPAVAGEVMAPFYEAENTAQPPKEGSR